MRREREAEKTVNVITFFGAEAKVGATMIAQSVAEELTQRGRRVLMVFASSEMCDCYIQGAESVKTGIDDLIDIDEIGDSDIRHVIAKQGKLSYIKGIMRPLRIKRLLQPRYFFNRLIRLTEKDFDYMIIDGGHNYQYPLPIGSLMAAHKCFFVLNPKARAFSRFRILTEILLMTISDSMCDEREIILNKVNGREDAYNASHARELFGMEVSQVHEAASSAACEVMNQVISRVNRTFKKEIAAVADRVEQVK